MSQPLKDDDRTMALVAHALTFVEGGIIGPIVVYVIFKDKSNFVAFHALQSFLFGVAFSILALVTLVATCGVLTVPVLLVYLIFEAIACVKALEGEWYRLPVVGDYAYERHPPQLEGLSEGPP